MEVAFQAKLKSNDVGEVVLDAEWFNKRLEDCTYRIPTSVDFQILKDIF
jgi:hypothetical protein